MHGSPTWPRGRHRQNVSIVHLSCSWKRPPWGRGGWLLGLVLPLWQCDLGQVPRPGACGWGECRIPTVSAAHGRCSPLLLPPCSLHLPGVCLSPPPGARVLGSSREFLAAAAAVAVLDHDRCLPSALAAVTFGFLRLDLKKKINIHSGIVLDGRKSCQEFCIPNSWFSLWFTSYVTTERFSKLRRQAGHTTVP